MIDLNGDELTDGDFVVVINKMHNEMCHGRVLEARAKTCDVSYTPSLGPGKVNRFKPEQILLVKKGCPLVIALL